MARLNKRHIPIIVFAVLIVTAVGVSVGAAETTLVVADAESGEHLLEVPVNDGDEVVLSYTHSVEKTPVQDVYVVNGTNLRMDRMVFHSYGAGLPATEPVEQTDDGFVVQANESYKKLPVVPGSIAGHTLIVGEDQYDLAGLSEGAVVISLTDRSVGDTLPLNISVVPEYDI